MPANAEIAALYPYTLSREGRSWTVRLSQEDMDLLVTAAANVRGAPARALYDALLEMGQ